MTRLTIGFSPCPNDTFIFDALLNEKIDTEGLLFEAVIEDVETLNRKAFSSQLDVTKLSFHAFAYVMQSYSLLDSGSALGKNCGPLLISAVNHPLPIINRLKIAIPGKYTTANLLFSIAFPKAADKVEMIFSEIENAVLSKRVDAGVIIHENRFTYQSKGLMKILDMGEYWEQLTGCPIPLGCIAVRKDLPHDLQMKINRVLRKSVEFAFADPSSPMDFVKSHAQEMEEEVMKQHIDLYVNDFTLSLGEDGRRAVKKLFEKSEEMGILKTAGTKIFYDE